MATRPGLRLAGARAQWHRARLDQRPCHHHAAARHHRGRPWLALLRRHGPSGRAAPSRLGSAAPPDGGGDGIAERRRGGPLGRGDSAVVAAAGGLSLLESRLSDPAASAPWKTKTTEDIKFSLTCIVNTSL